MCVGGGGDAHVPQCMRWVPISSPQLEVLGMCNLLQVIFLGIRLDRVVEWRWAVSGGCGLVNCMH